MVRTKDTALKSYGKEKTAMIYTDTQRINSLAAFRHFHSRNDLTLSNVENSALDVEGWALYFNTIARDTVVLSSLFQQLDSDSFSSIIHKLNS